MSKNGAPGEIRTPDPLIRSQVLYPAELRARVEINAGNACGSALYTGGGNGVSIKYTSNVTCTMEALS